MGREQGAADRVEYDDEARAVGKRAIARPAKPAFTFGREKGCGPCPALLKSPVILRTRMNSISPGAAAQSPRSVGERALEHFLAAGFVRMEPPILHPAAVFLDMSGEEIHGRLFLTSGAAGEELCLRPEYTIPVCRAYLASDKAGRTAEYSYLGPVFRSQVEGGERVQTGLESFGRRDTEAADAEIFALSMEAAADVGGALSARLGDAGLFDSLLEALSLPSVWRRRLRRGVAQGRGLASILDGRGASALAQPGVLAALESVDHAGAKALVEDLLAIAGIDAVGGRSAGEIADRFLEQAALRSGEPIDPEKRKVLGS
jgi:ATP phosphoribosyltransferase regulatory subunit